MCSKKVTPELGVEIDPDMALTPLPSSIGWGSNPQPSDRAPSALPLDHSFCLRKCGDLAQPHTGFPRYSRSSKFAP